jgi:hypothetical protein
MSSTKKDQLDFLKTIFRELRAIRCNLFVTTLATLQKGFPLLSLTQTEYLET